MLINIREELCISCCWSIDKWSHGVSGHIFEIIEYYYILREKYDTCILLGDPRMSRDWLHKLLVDKYNFNLDEIHDIISSTRFCENPPTYVKCDKILFVDGCLVKMQAEGIKVFSNQIYTFKCSRYETIYDLQLYKNVVPLLDYRVYTGINQRDVDIGINYIKKVLIDRLRKSEQTEENTGMLYLTSNCRALDRGTIMGICDLYNIDKYIIVTDSDNYFSLPGDKFTIMKPPVDNLFEKFSTYIYTPTDRRWDGSPRFPVECHHHQKHVIYHNIGEQYLEHDLGLNVRIQDIDNCFDELYLKHTDDILKII